MGSSVRRPVAAALLPLVVAGCTVESGSFAGKTCNTATDCGFGYTCVIARAGGTATCEVLWPDILTPPPNPTPTGQDYYCTDVQPLLQGNCITCHVYPIPPEPPLIPNWFVLNSYGDDVDAGVLSDGGLVLGAFHMASLSAQYVTNGLMPLSPSSVPTPLTAAQQQVFANWFASGAPFCDGGTTMPDAGSSDAGSSDAGDGG